MKLIVGVKQVVKSIENGSAIRVFLAQDADGVLTESLAELVCKKEIETVFVPTRAQLGKMCRIAVGAAAAAEIKE